MIRVARYVSKTFWISPLASVASWVREEMWLLSEVSYSANGERPRRIGIRHIEWTERLAERISSLDHSQDGGALLRQAISGARLHESCWSSLSTVTRWARGLRLRPARCVGGRASGDALS